MCELRIIGEDPETALLPSRFLTPFSHRRLRRLRTRFPAFILRMFAGKLKHLRRPASSGPDSRKRRFEKAKPSTVAAAVSGPSLSFLATQNGREPKIFSSRLMER
jgi:hypothetical protein